MAPPPPLCGGGRLRRLAFALALLPFAVRSSDEEGSCPAGKAADGSGCLAAKENVSACTDQGFDPKRLSCGTCRLLGQRLEEEGGSEQAIVKECFGCCQEAKQVERFGIARLIADAGQQERDQDLHDFIKRKAPLFPGLEVEYLEGAMPAIELENDEQPERVVRADVSGWKSNHLYEFLEQRLRTAEVGEKAEVKMAVEGAWTAEVQSCSG
uniref:Selenoprotein F n=1 Tax=Alexandrium monilatum TaxID=311494 RepID=A0A7S4SA43_9DINO|mmetsp:Transcript_68553/g.203959  ORF Transcript_68553/g.203959 Transcript_68553/m.203959 type:complete len:211 (+) Transcript_68553:87-719(+)